MDKKNLFNVGLLTFGAMIWGSAFLFQDIGMKFVEPFTFNVFRCLFSTIFLVIFSLAISIFNKKRNITSNVKYNKKDLILGSIISGIFIAGAMGTQQIGISLEGAGRSGFITSLYIIFVPLISLVFGKKVHPLVLIGLVFSITGLYLINLDGTKFEFTKGTFWLLACAILYALQILSIDYFSPKCDSIKLTAGQFLIGGLFQIPFMFIFETPIIKNVIDAIVPILYCGIISSGIGFTIQVYTQKRINPTIASLIMGLESVFAIIFASIFLHETYRFYEILGCIFIFTSVIISQLPTKKRTELNHS